MISIDKYLFQSFDVILPRTATVNTCELLEIGRVEKEWAVANCGEVWSAREAILNGAKFDELTFQSINASNGAAKELCKNCQKTFEGHY